MFEDFKETVIKLFGKYGDSTANIVNQLNGAKDAQDAIGKLKVLRGQNLQRVQGIGDELERVEQHTLGLKKKYDASPSRGKKETIAIEIESYLDELEAKKPGLAVLKRNVQMQTQVISKLEEYLTRKELGIDEGWLDDAAVELDTKFSEYDYTQKAMKDFMSVSSKEMSEEKLSPEDTLKRVDKLSEGKVEEGGEKKLEERLKKLGLAEEE